MTEIGAQFREFQVEKRDADLPLQFKDPVNEDRVVRFRASDDTLDRYNEVIVASGWDLTEFAQNPVMMQFHDYHSWPIGTVVAAGVIGEALFVDGEFDPPDVDENADKVFRKVQHGTVRTGSVGFIPDAWITPGNTKAADETALVAKYPDAERIYIKQRLLEWTICPIPANPNALAASLRSYAVRFGGTPISREVATDVPAIPAAMFDTAQRIIDNLKT